MSEEEWGQHGARERGPGPQAGTWVARTGSLSQRSFRATLETAESLPHWWRLDENTRDAHTTAVRPACGEGFTAGGNSPGTEGGAVAL